MAELKQVLEDTPEYRHERWEKDQRLLANRQAQQYDTATPDGMDALTQSLIRSKHAGANLTGLDGQLLQAAKLRDTKFNADGAYQTGGIGAAMGAFANVLDRRQGRNEYNGLQQQATDAKRLVADATARREANELQRQDASDVRAEESHQSVLKKAIDAQKNSDRQYQLDLKAEGREQLEFDHERELANLNAGFKGKDATASTVDSTNTQIVGLGKLNEILGQYEADPTLFQVATDVPLESLQKATTWAVKNGLGEYAAKLKGGTPEEQDATLQHMRDASRLRSNLELAFKGDYRHELIGSAQGVVEAANVENAINMTASDDPQAQLESMRYLQDFAQSKLVGKARPSNFTRKQYESISQDMAGIGYQRDDKGRFTRNTDDPAATQGNVPPNATQAVLAPETQQNSGQNTAPAGGLGRASGRIPNNGANGVITGSSQPPLPELPDNLEDFVPGTNAAFDEFLKGGQY